MAAVSRFSANHRAARAFGVCGGGGICVHRGVPLRDLPAVRLAVAEGSYGYLLFPPVHDRRRSTGLHSGSIARRENSALELRRIFGFNGRLLPVLSPADLFQRVALEC